MKVICGIGRRLPLTAKVIQTLNLELSTVSFHFFSARCNIYISRLCYDVIVRLSVCLSATEVLWRIIANLGFKFRSQFTAHCVSGACGCKH